jgi:asparagine synthase (glutamine-hydrolysing)
MSKALNDMCERLRLLLQKAVKENLAEGLLLSGGLDTSILAVVASKMGSLKAFTVGYEDASAPDMEFAKLVADRLKLKHVMHAFNYKELSDAVSKVIGIMKSFDPMEVRNDAAIYIGLKLAKESGVSSVMTGDAADELFAGYSFFFGLERDRLELELQKMWRIMRFSSVDLGNALGVAVKLPYLHTELKAFAMEVDPELKVRSESGHVYGKWILRKAFENILPSEIVWRVKTPIEMGSGTAALTGMFNSIISDTEFEEKRQEYLNEDKVTVRDKEQLCYYETFRSIIGVPHSKLGEGKICPFCNSNVNIDSTYCRTCGAYPI